MVACRITDARNIAAANNHQHQHHQQQQHLHHNRSTGSISSGQVPLKKYKQTRISSLTAILIAILHWIWPPDRCTNCHSIYSSPNQPESDYDHHHHHNHQQTLDNSIDVVDGALFERRNSNVSQKSSSDDGGFLSRRNFITARASWRRPLVAASSQVSLQSAADSARGFFLNGLGGLLKIGNNNTAKEAVTGARYQNVAYGNGPLHINTISAGLMSPQPHNYTPSSRVSRIFSSSPASTPGHHQLLAYSNPHFSDLSTVYPNSAERSNLSRYRYQSQELPSLRTIQEETRRQQQQQPLTNHQHQLEQRWAAAGSRSPCMPNASSRSPCMPTAALEDHFVPLQLPSPPSWRNYYQSQSQLPSYQHSYRPRTRWYPRHYSRLFSPLPQLQLNLNLGLDASPESRSSSSGFGSKNTSNHPGSTSEWRLLPPYRAPPSPPKHFGGNQRAQAQTLVTGQQPYQYSYQSIICLRRPNCPVDVGSVDGHYEFDPATPTPSASTPRDDLNLHIDTHHYPNQHSYHNHHLNHHHNHHTLGPLSGSLLHASSAARKLRSLPRYDNVEARLQAMREEFYAYRQRQAMQQTNGPEIESVC
ncbi:hypothetical protein ACLKA6_019081 [Drosophila palustris]